MKVNTEKKIIGVLLLFILVGCSSQNEQVVIEDSAQSEQASTAIYVDIEGEVNSPGLYEMQQGDRINDAIEIASGYSANADQTCLNKSKIIHDQDLIYIPSKEQGCENEAIVNGVVNINLANECELMQIDGVGETRAQAIYNYREENGLFKEKEDLKNVDGIGEETYNSIESQISV